METYRKKVTQVGEVTEQNSLNQAGLCSCAHRVPSGDMMGVWGHLCITNVTWPRSSSHRDLCP